MNVAMKRDRLITYLADANNKKVSALYSLLEEEIKEQGGSYFTPEQLAILDARRTDLLSGKDKGTDWKTIHDNVRRKRKRNIGSNRIFDRLACLYLKTGEVKLLTDENTWGRQNWKF